MKHFLQLITLALFFVVTSHETLHADGVGFTRLTIDDPMGGEMLVSIWYPTLAPSGTVKLGPYKFKAARDAEPSQGQRGLVVMSHGAEGSDLGHRNVAIAMAHMGMIVAAPLHPRDNFKDNSGVGRRVVMEGRPRQITAVIDALLSNENWRKRIDTGRIGAFGFSLGGYTVLAALGAQPDIMRIVEHCETSTPDPFCEALGARGKALRNQVAQEFTSPLTHVKEPRICAATIVDPVAVSFSNASLAGITARHVQVWLPEHQNILLAKAHVGRVVENLNTRRDVTPVQEILVKGAQHYSFLAPFPRRLKWVLPSVITKDTKEFDRPKFQKAFA